MDDVYSSTVASVVECGVDAPPPLLSDEATLAVKSINLTWGRPGAIRLCQRRPTVIDPSGIILECDWSWTPEHRAVGRAIRGVQNAPTVGVYLPK